MQVQEAPAADQELVPAEPTTGPSGEVQMQIENITPVSSPREVSTEEHQVQVHTVGEEEDDDSDKSDWSDQLIQGDVAPKVPVLVQKEMKKNGVFLVITTNVFDQVWTTQLVDGTLMLKEQAEIRSKGGKILITRDLDTYRVANMNLDVEWLEHQVRMRRERQEGLLLRVFEEVLEIWKGRAAILRAEEVEEQSAREGQSSMETQGIVQGETSNVVVSGGNEIEVQQNPQGEDEEESEETSDEDYNPEEDTDKGEESSSEEEEHETETGQEEVSGIGEMLQELSEESSAKESMVGSPRASKPKRRRKHSQSEKESGTGEESEESTPS